MPLLDKIRGRNGQPKLAAHQITAAVAEVKRGRNEFGNNLTERKATVTAMFGLTSAEADEIQTLAQSAFDRQEIHDVLMIAEMRGADNPYSDLHPNGDTNLLNRLGITDV